MAKLRRTKKNVNIVTIPKVLETNDANSYSLINIWLLLITSQKMKRI